MKRLLPWLALLLCASAAAQQQQINCATNVPCNPTTGPVNTGRGDQPYQFNGKTNQNFGQLYSSFGSNSSLFNTGTVSAADVVSRFSGICDSAHFLSGSGQCLTGFNGYVSLVDAGAKLNVLSTVGCSVTASANLLTCPAATFSSADMGKAIAVTGAGANAQTTLTSTITSFVSATQVHLAANAVTTTPISFAIGVPNEVACGSGYTPGDGVTLTGGTFVTASTLSVRSTRVCSATVTAAGSGAINGSCTIFGTTGTGAHFAAAVTIAGNSLSAINGISIPGYYTVNPTVPTAEPVTSTCGLTGATVNLVIGPNVMGITTPGNYSVAPCGTTPCASTVAQGSTTGSGTGATFSVEYASSGVVTYGTDDTAAWNTAIAAVNFAYSTSAKRACIVMPAGVSWITPPLTIFSGPGCVVGTLGDYKSTLYLSPAGSGDVFSWTDAWFASDWPFNGTTTTVSTQKTGPTLLGVSCIGDRSAASDVTFAHLYDRNDFVHFDRVDCNTLKGQFIKTGDQKNTTQSFIRESYFGELRCYQCGDTGKAVIEFYASGNGTGGTPVDIDNLNIYAPYGDGVYMHNDAAGNLRGYHYKHIRDEGLENNTPGLAGHLLHIGNASQLGVVNSIEIDDAQLISPYFGYDALYLDGTAATLYDVRFKGEFLGSTAEGGCVGINGGRLIYLTFTVSSCTQPVLTVASSASVSPYIVVDGGGGEGAFSTNIDASVVTYVLTPLRTTLVPGQNLGLYANLKNLSLRCQANNTTTCGNAIGSAAIDLQTAALSNPNQVAAGASAIAIGAQNSVIGGQGINIGVNNSGSGTNGINIGFRGADRGRYHSFCTAAGQFNVQGDAQDCPSIVLRQTTNGASAVRLTSDAATASAVNCVNLPNSSAFSLVLSVNANDHTTAGKNAMWEEIPLYLTRGATIGTTAVNISSSTPAATFSNGTLTGMALSITADTTFGCLNVSFTPPTGNTDTWDVVASVRSLETQ